MYQYLVGGVIFAVAYLALGMLLFESLLEDS